MMDVTKSEWSQTVAIPGWDIAKVGSDAARQFCTQGQVVTQAFADLNAECSRFVMLRMNRTSEAITEISKCQSLPEIFAVQAKWLQDAVGDCVQEANSLMDVNNKIIGGLIGQIVPK